MQSSNPLHPNISIPIFSHSSLYISFDADQENFFHPLTPMDDKTEFLLTVSVQYQPDRWWEYRKISILGIISWSNTKFSKLML